LTHTETTRHAPNDADHIHIALVDEAATERAGRLLAGVLRAGDCVLLSGPLGAGKSALARAIIRARLGDPDAEVPSPSYTLVNVYAPPGAPGPEAEGPEIWHADLYRLASPEETDELGLGDALPSALTLIEWPDRLGPLIPPRHLALTLAYADSGRILTAEGLGAGWSGALAALADAEVRR